MTRLREKQTISSDPPCYLLPPLCLSLCLLSLPFLSLFQPIYLSVYQSIFLLHFPSFLSTFLCYSLPHSFFLYLCSATFLHIPLLSSIFLFQTPSLFLLLVLNPSVFPSLPPSFQCFSSHPYPPLSILPSSLPSLCQPLHYCPPCFPYVSIPPLPI